MSELKDKTIKGIMWSGIGNFSIKGIGFLMTLFMARLLIPSDYGMIGMIAIFSALSMTFVDSGFSLALIRKPDRTEKDISTMFFFNIGVASIIYILLYIIAPYVANFYKIPQLCLVMRVSNIGIIICSFRIIQSTLYTIHLDFKTPTKLGFISIIVSAIIGVYMAYMGYGVWALIGQVITNDICYTVLLWAYSPWRPSKIFSIQSLREMFSYGSKLLASGILDTIYSNIYPIVIGKVYTAGDLGYYSRAASFANFPSSNITGIINKVTFPVLSKLQNDPELLRRSYRKFIKLSAYIIFPLMCGMSAISKPMITVLIGDKWFFSAILLQIVCFSAMWYPIHAINLSLLQVTGRSDLFLRLEIIKKILGIIILCITIPKGLIYMCYGGIINCIISLILNTYYTGKLINVGFILQMKDISSTFILSINMFIITKIIILNIDNSIIALIAGISVGIMFYVSMSYLFKINEFNELRNILTQYIIKRHEKE